MSGLRVLFIGGTGVISSACVREAVARDPEVVVLNRGQSTTRPLPSTGSNASGQLMSPVTVTSR